MGDAPNLEVTFVEKNPKMGPSHDPDTLKLTRQEERLSSDPPDPCRAQPDGVGPARARHAMRVSIGCYLLSSNPIF